MVDSAAMESASPDRQLGRLLESADLLHAQGHLDRAQEMLHLALRIRPRAAAARNALGLVLFDAGRIEAALAEFRAACAIEPRAAGAWGNAGMALKTLDRFDESIAAYDEALSLDPASPQLRLNRAVALLRAGRMAEAWQDYESRLTLRRDAMPLHRVLIERLLPTLRDPGDFAGLDLRGRTVLAVHEEGFGDTLMFIRYARLLAERGARVVVRAPRQLVRVLQGVRGVAEVIDGDAPLPPFDYAIPVFSLPRAFATTLTTIPADIPYLRADPALVAHWQAHVPWRGSRKLRVGLVWAGQARPWLEGFAALDRRRSAGLACFAPLAEVDATFASLQVGERPPPPPGLFLHDVMEGVADFADTAALIETLDVVVSVDTSVVHLAGGMGKTVFLADRFDSCWRWLSGRTDSPWYPTLRIFRQAEPGDWAGVMARIAASLRAMAAGARA
jgi:tetratricopeptide (TPR) repeat protein